MLIFLHLLYTFRHGFAGINSPKGCVFTCKVISYFHFSLERDIKIYFDTMLYTSGFDNNKDASDDSDR